MNQTNGAMLIFAIIILAIWIPSLWIKIPATVLIIFSSFFLFNQGETIE